MRMPKLIAVVAAAGLLAGCGGGRPGGSTVGRAPSGPPPAPPAGALTLARQLRGLGVAVAVSAAPSQLRVRATILGAQGYGVDGLRVRIAGAPTAPCGHGCYTGTSPPTRALRVEVGARSVVFPLPQPPFRTGTGLLRRIEARYHRARTAVFDERLASAPGQVVTSSWRLAAPASLSYTASDGSSGVIIGRRRWDKYRGGRWQESPQTPRLPQPALPWSRSPIDVMELPPARVDGRPVVSVSFFDPGVPAWYTVAASPRTHELVRVEMVAPAHFMRDEYRGLDVPVVVRPPQR